VSTLLWLITAITTTTSIAKVLPLNYMSNLHRNGTSPHVDTTYAMSEFDEYTQGRKGECER